MRARLASKENDLDPALAALLTDIVQHAAYLGQDAYGKPNYTAPVNRPARVEWRTEMGMAGGTREFVSETVVYCDANFIIDERDRIVLPDGSAPAIGSIERWSDENGNADHYRLHL